jgi:G:T/U-mismatch repair DNA glycosylase
VARWIGAAGHDHDHHHHHHAHDPNRHDARIRAVCLNGGTAHSLYLRRVQPRLPDAFRALPLHRLPSTSPAHATLRFEQKLESWRILQTLQQH